MRTPHPQENHNSDGHH